jgi:hypothetical protein
MDISGSRYEIRVNDVPIKEEKIGYPIITLRPINQWIKSGTNTISVMLYPLPDESSLSKDLNCSVMVRVRRSTAADSENQVISEISYSGKMAKTGKAIANSTQAGRFDSHANFTASEQGDVLVSEITVKPTPDGQGIILSRTVDLPLPFPRWKWLDSDIIPDTEVTKKELLKQYLIIWNALKAKDVDSILPLFKQRNEEAPDSLYLNESDLAKRLKSNFESDIKDMVLWESMPEYALLHIWGEGRLARITDWEGNSFIAFVNEENTVSTDYDIIFRKSGDKWIITR